MRIKFRNKDATLRAIRLLSTIYKGDNELPINNGDGSFTVSVSQYDTLLYLGYHFEDVIEEPCYKNMGSILLRSCFYLLLYSIRWCADNGFYS